MNECTRKRPKLIIWLLEPFPKLLPSASSSPDWPFRERESLGWAVEGGEGYWVGELGSINATLMFQ